MRFACWVTKATDTHSQCAFTRQQWLLEHASMFRLCKHSIHGEKCWCMLLSLGVAESPRVTETKEAYIGVCCVVSSLYVIIAGASFLESPVAN
jgi:hypothetical protein